MARKQAVDELAPYVLAKVEGLEEGEKDVEELDSGAYGIVFKVTVNKLPCMAKRLHKVLIKGVSARERASIQKKFRDECVLLSKLNHPNIVHFVGVYYGESRDDLMLIMERLHSDVATYVETHPNIPISIKVSILLDVSYGLLYLHGQTPPIVHRDLTAPNILLTSDLRAKIADLGVSKVLSDPLMIKQTTVPGNAYYMAPETKFANPRYDVMIDIFALGHLALHISIQDWPKTHRVEDHRSVQHGKMEIAERKKALEEGMGKDHCLYQLAINCLQDHPERRPSTKELNSTLKRVSVEHPKTDDVMQRVSGVTSFRLENKTVLETAYKESQETVRQLENDVARFGREKDLYRERTVGQQAMLENLQKDLGDSRRKVTQLTSGIERQQTEFQQVSRQRDEVLGELEAHRLTAQTFQEDFQAERQDREKAHSKVAEMEQRFTHQIQALANELQQKAKENEAVRQALANQKLGQNKEQGSRLQGENRKLQEEIQSKTQQVKQYKKQVDQFRVEVEANKEQADIHRVQVETSVLKAENLARENDRLRRDNDNLNARLRHAGATSVDPRQPPISDQLKRENEDLQRQAAKYLETINELKMRSGLLQSELEELKKGRGVAPPQALPNHPRISEPPRQQIVNRPILPPRGANRPSYQPPLHTNQPSHQPHTGQPSQPYPFVSQHHSHTSHQPRPPSSHQGQPSHAQRQHFQLSKALSVDDSHLHSHGTHQNIDQSNERPLQTGREQPRYVDNSSENPNRYPVYDNLPFSSGFGPQGPASLPLSAALGSPSPTHDRQAFQYGGGNGFQKQQLGQMQGRPGEGNPQQHQTPDIVDKDSPPASYQASSLNIQQNQENQLRAQFDGTRSPSSNADIRTPAGQHSCTNQPLGTNADSAVRNPAMRPLPPSENPNRYPVYDNLPLASGFGPQGPASLPLSAALGSPSPTHDRQAFQYGGGNGFQKQQLGQMQGRPGEGNPQQHQTPDIVDKDSPPASPPASYQPSSLNIQNQLRAQFAGKPQGMTSSADGYLQPSSAAAHARPQQARPLPTPRVQVEYGSGGPPYPGGAGRQLQGYQGGQRGQLGSGNVSYYNPPGLLRSHGQNVYNPQMHGVPRFKEDTYTLENLLLQGIDDDIQQAAEEVQKEDDESEASLSEVPFDPNLVCPICMKHFRLGKIQKYKRHVAVCVGEKEEREKIPQPQTPTEWRQALAGDTEAMSLKLQTLRITGKAHPVSSQKSTSRKSAASEGDDAKQSPSCVRVCPSCWRQFSYEKLKEFSVHAETCRKK